MASSIADFLIEIGFSGDAIKGLKAVEKQLDSLEKKKKEARKKEREDIRLEKKRAKQAFSNDRKKGLAKQAKEKARIEQSNQAKIDLQKRLKAYKQQKADIAALKNKSAKEKELLLKQARKEQFLRDKQRGERIRQERDQRKLESTEAQRRLKQRLAERKKALKKENDLAESQRKKNFNERRNRRINAVRRARKQRNLDQFRQVSALNVTNSKSFQSLSPTQQNLVRTELKNVKNTRDVQLLRAKINRDAQAYTSKLKTQNYLLRRQVDSAKQLTGNMVSAFAVVGAGVGLTQVGMDFESINAGMLAASSSSEDAGKNLKFVQDESVRLGLSLKETAKSYTKLLASNQGQLSQQDVEGLFTGVSEASTVLGLSQDDQVGTIRAYCIGSLY